MKCYEKTLWEMKCNKKTARERRGARYVELPNGRVFQQILEGGEWAADGNRRETKGKPSAF